MLQEMPSIYIYIYIYYFILLCHDYFSISFIILFYFHCYSALSFTFPLQISFDLVLHLLCFISCLCYCIYYTFYHYLSSVIFWDENKGVPTVSLFFSYRNMRKHALFCFLFVFCWVFFRLLFFKGTCFQFYLIAVLIYLYFIIYRWAHNVFETLQRCLFWPISLRVALNLAGNEAWVVTEILYSMRWCVGAFSAFKESCIINF